MSVRQRLFSSYTNSFFRLIDFTGATRRVFYRSYLNFEREIYSLLFDILIERRSVSLLFFNLRLLSLSWILFMVIVLFVALIVCLVYVI